MGKELTVEALNAMTRTELCTLIGIGDNQLIFSGIGLVDILGVKDGKVSYGFLINGHVVTESIDKFLSRFKDTKPVDLEHEEGKVMGRSKRLMGQNDIQKEQR